MGFIPREINQQLVKYVGTSDRLKNLSDHKVLHYEGNTNLPKFGHLDSGSSEIVGFDMDICRAIAATIFADNGASQIKVVTPTSKLRIAALHACNVNVMTRNTTLTMIRHSEIHLNYGGATFYDVLVRVYDQNRKLSDHCDKSIYVQVGSISECNIIEYFE